MKTRIYSRTLLLLALLTAPGAATLHGQASNDTITVKSGGLRQSFAGFGASQASTAWNAIAATPRNQMADMVYRDLKMNVLRLWAVNFDTKTVAENLATFNATYLASGAVAGIKSRGVTTLLLAPETGTAGNHAPTVPIPTYTENLAEFILQLKNTYGVTIDVTGVCNEPESSWTLAQIIDCIGSLRASLDARGLAGVKIIAPESSNPGSAANSVAAIRGNPAAWSSLYGIASHSYGAVLPNDDLYVRKSGKAWWMTEASDSGSEQAEDENRACSILARYLCEMNFGVDEWIFFIGLGQVSDNSTYTIGSAFLMLYDLKTASIVPMLKYYYFKQALNTFDARCVFRKCVSAAEGDMLLNYVGGGTNRNPAINAAAAFNPDGSWGITVVNDTGVTGSPATGLNLFYPAAAYNITLTVEELTNTPSMAFAVHRSSASNHVVASGTVTLTNGMATFPVAARELVSLRSGATAPAIPPAPGNLSGSTVNAPVSLNWHNTVNAACWNIKRSTVRGGPYTVIATAATTHYDDHTAASGVLYHYVVSASNAVGESADSPEVTAARAPFPWKNTDIGNVGLTGSLTVSDEGVFTAYGAGKTVGSTNDSFNFTYKTMKGNGTLVARLARARQTNNSRAGIMMCETLDTAPKAVCVVYDFNGVWKRTMLCSRTTAGTAGSWSSSAVTGVPTWFKLTRSGNTFTGYASTDGKNWAAFTSRTVAMSNTLYAGLVDCANNTDLCEATFDNVSAPCAAPTEVKEDATPRQVRLGWTAAFGARSYTVKRATVSGGPYTAVGSVDSPSIAFTDTAVSAGTNYFYVISAVNEAGESADSEEAEAWTVAEKGTRFQLL